MLLETNFN